jgi:hypothetical protein
MLSTPNNSISKYGSVSGLLPLMFAHIGLEDSTMAIQILNSLVNGLTALKLTFQLKLLLILIEPLQFLDHLEQVIPPITQFKMVNAHLIQSSSPNRRLTPSQNVP